MAASTAIPASKKKDLINLEDAENDLLLLDDEELIPYPFSKNKKCFLKLVESFKIGEVFVRIKMDDANQLIEQQKEKLQQQMEGFDSQAEELKKHLSELKVKLYGKFGNNINLEEDEE
eukprot:gene18661-20543_t